MSDYEVLPDNGTISTKSPPEAEQKPNKKIMAWYLKINLG